MYKRKNFLIDKKFQFKATFTIIGFIFVIVALLTILIGFNALDTNKKVENIIEIQDNIVQVLAYSEPIEDDSNEDGPSIMNRKMAQNHADNIKTLQAMIKRNVVLIWSMIIIMFLQGVVLFFVLIRQTHRIAGPLYVMGIYMKEIIDGKVPDNLRNLRESDLLKEFYDLFCEMVNSLKTKKAVKKIPAQKKATVKKAVKKSPKKAKAVKKVATKKTNKKAANKTSKKSTSKKKK